jgi:hypothetical protein
MIQKAKIAAVKTVNATNGNKTVAAAIAYVVVQLFGDKIPLIRDNIQAVEYCIVIAMEIGVGHKLWKFINNKIKNRKVKQSIKN